MVVMVVMVGSQHDSQELEAAYREDDRVSVDGISDHQHSVVEVTTIDGRSGHVLVCRAG